MFFPIVDGDKFGQDDSYMTFNKMKESRTGFSRFL